jgi:hypothetical protein
MIVNLPPALHIKVIADRGNLALERVHLEVARDCDISSYLIMATIEAAPGKVYAGFRPAYWFTTQQVKTGDHVIVYTREGTDSKELRPDGHVNHFLYWGVKNNAMFGPTGRVVLAELNTWQTGG